VTWCAVIALEALWLLATLRPWTSSGARRVLRGPATAAATCGRDPAGHRAGQGGDHSGTDWADTLVAYKRHSGIAGELAEIAGRWGLLPLALVAAAVVAGLRRRPTRRPVAMLAVQALLIFVLFRRLQDPSPQHWYLYLPGLTVLLGLLLARTAASLAAPARRGAWIAAATAAGLAVSATVLSAGPGDGRWGRLAPAFRIRPAVRHDLAEVGDCSPLSTRGSRGSGLGLRDRGLRAAHRHRARLRQPVARHLVQLAPVRAVLGPRRPPRRLPRQPARGPLHRAARAGPGARPAAALPGGVPSRRAACSRARASVGPSAGDARSSPSTAG